MQSDINEECERMEAAGRLIRKFLLDNGGDPEGRDTSLSISREGRLLHWCTPSSGVLTSAEWQDRGDELARQVHRILGPQYVVDFKPMRPGYFRTYIAEVSRRNWVLPEESF